MQIDAIYRSLCLVRLVRTFLEAFRGLSTLSLVFRDIGFQRSDSTSLSCCLVRHKVMLSPEHKLSSIVSFYSIFGLIKSASV